MPQPPRSLKADNAAETDWRVKEMMDSVRTYFGVWSGKVRRKRRREKGRERTRRRHSRKRDGLFRRRKTKFFFFFFLSHITSHLPTTTPSQDPSTVDVLLSDDFVHVDEIWSGAEVVAGLSNFKKFVARTREAYPDLAISVEDSGAAGAHRVFVRWSGSATNLGRYHGAKASRHASALSGIDLFTFSPDRSKLEEVLVYRTPLAEDKVQLESFEAENHGLHELKLHRLHEEGKGGGGKK